MQEISPVVGQFDQPARVLHGIELAPVNMHLRLREIRQTASMVKVQVGQDDMLHILRRVTQPGNLTNRTVLGVLVNAKIELEKSNHAGGVEIIMQAEAGIHQNKALVGFHQQAGPADMPVRKPGGHGSAIEDEDGHEKYLIIRRNTRSALHSWKAVCISIQAVATAASPGGTITHRSCQVPHLAAVPPVGFTLCWAVLELKVILPRANCGEQF